MTIRRDLQQSSVPDLGAEIPEQKDSPVLSNEPWFRTLPRPTPLSTESLRLPTQMSHPTSKLSG